MKRAIVIGDVVVIRPESAEDLQREGYDSVRVRVPAKIVDSWMVGSRRVFSIDLDCGHALAIKCTTVWANQVRLATNAITATEKRVAKMVAAKAAREAARRIPKQRSKRK